MVEEAKNIKCAWKGESGYRKNMGVRVTSNRAFMLSKDVSLFVELWQATRTVAWAC